MARYGGGITARSVLPLRLRAPPVGEDEVADGEFQQHRRSGCREHTDVDRRHRDRRWTADHFSLHFELGTAPERRSSATELRPLPDEAEVAGSEGTMDNNQLEISRNSRVGESVRFERELASCSSVQVEHISA